MLFSSAFRGAEEGAGLVGHLAGVKNLRNAYKIVFINSEGKYLRD
jgi:hypothetical protein